MKPLIPPAWPTPCYRTPGECFLVQHSCYNPVTWRTPVFDTATTVFPHVELDNNDNTPVEGVHEYPYRMRFCAIL